MPRPDQVQGPGLGPILGLAEHHLPDPSSPEQAEGRQVSPEALHVERVGEGMEQSGLDPVHQLLVLGVDPDLRRESRPFGAIHRDLLVRKGDQQEPDAVEGG